MDNNISLVECLALPAIQKKVSAIDAVEIEEVDFDMTGNETIASHEDQTEEAMDMDVFQQRSLWFQVLFNFNLGRIWTIFERHHQYLYLLINP